MVVCGRMPSSRATHTGVVVCYCRRRSLDAHVPKKFTYIHTVHIHMLDYSYHDTPAIISGIPGSLPQHHIHIRVSSSISTNHHLYRPTATSQLGSARSCPSHFRSLSLTSCRPPTVPSSALHRGNPLRDHGVSTVFRQGIDATAGVSVNVSTATVM